MSEEPTTSETSPNNQYLELLTVIQNDPYSNEVWTKAVELAKSEEETGKGTESFYTHVPLGELIAVGERLRSTRLRNEQYDILTEKCSTGESWYDIVLGHMNDKSFAPIALQLEEFVSKAGRKFERGLDLGTGTGNTIRAASPFFNEIIGVDKQESVLHKTKYEPSFPKNARAVVADATNLPFVDNYLDAVVSNGLIHYLSKEDMQQYVREVARVLNGNGFYMESFVTSVEGNTLPSTEQEYLASGKAMLACLIDNLVSTLKPGEVQNKWTLKDVAEMFKEQGFDFDYSDENSDGVWWVAFYRPH